MIYLNGKDWGKGYEEHLKKLFGSELPTFKKNLVFTVTDRYKGLRKLGSGTSPVAWKETTASSSPMPIEFTTFVDGKACVLKYVERVEMRVEQGKNGPTQIPIEHPGSMYMRDGRFEVKKHKFELWIFLLMSPYCENGFDTDTTPADGSEGKKNIWGFDMKEVRDNVANRATSNQQPTYKYVDETVKLKAQLKADDEAFKAQKHIRDATEKDLRDMYAALGQPDSLTEEIEVIQLYLLSLAKEVATSSQTKSGAQRIFEVDSKTISFKATVTRASEAGVISYAKQKRAWRFEGEEILEIHLVPKGVNHIDSLVEFLRYKDDGGEVFEKIKAGLKKAELAEQE